VSADAGSAVFSEEDSSDSAPKSIDFRTMQIGQNSIAPENRLPQLGQVHLGLVSWI
jgi:hypothetical protein